MTRMGQPKFHNLFAKQTPRPDEMTRAMTQVRQLLPTLRERLIEPDEATLDQLQQRIEQQPDSGAVIELAHQLTSHDVLLLFPLLARMSTRKAAGTEVIRRLHLIIRERACPSMYQSGWIVFQRSYHQTDVGKALALLCSILEIRQVSQSDPGLHLISDIIRPDRQTVIRDLMKALASQQMTLADLTRGYQLDRELPLYQELSAHALLRGHMHQFSAASDQFASIFSHADQLLQIRLLKRLFKFWSMPSHARNLCCQVVYRRIGEPSDHHSVWQKIKKKDQRQFSRWLTSAKIGSHCRHHPERARLYLRYEAQIERVENWDDQTLLIYLPSGVIADSQSESDLAVFFDRTQAQRWLSKSQTASHLHPLSPMLPKRRVDEAIRRGSCRGVITLPFDQEGIRYTRIFLDLCLQTDKQAARARPSSRQVRRSD